jgi:hypothetical protein
VETLALDVFGSRSSIGALVRLRIARVPAAVHHLVGSFEQAPSVIMGH